MNKSQTSFGGLRVGAFESRRAEEMARLITRFGGIAHVSPSMREVPLPENPRAVDFAHRLLTGEVQLVIFLTGVGFRLLVDGLQRSVHRQRFLDALADITTIARGPKPAAAMRELDLQPTYQVAEPHTWREILVTIDEQMVIDNQTVAVQEYGKTNPSLMAGLEARGARVLEVPVYHWELPEDPRPLEENVRRLAARNLDVVLFTSAHQLTNVLATAERLGIVAPLREALAKTVVGSIGPTTSEMLRSLDLPVDLEPTHSKMGQLVQQAAAESAVLLERKRQIRSVLSGPAGAATDPQAPWYNSPFMKACRREPTEVTPVWLMRQAGRYMAEYRAVREKVSFLELCKDPSLCSEVMCTAVKRLGVDAAIIFSDLLPILEPMGFDLEFSKGGGPVIHNPVRESADVDRVVELESVDALHFVMETVQHTRNDLPADIPLIGFAGGTLYAGQLYHRGWGKSQLPAHQDLDVPRSRSVAFADGTTGTRRDAVLERPDCCWSPVRPVVRFLGRVPGSRRLPSIRPALRSADHTRNCSRRARHQLCHGEPGPVAAVGRGRGLRDRGGLAHPAGRRLADRGT